MLRRPPIELRVYPCRRSAWRLFRRHHYLSGELSAAAKCFVAVWEGTPVAFSAWGHRMTRTRRAGDMREHRTVVLPDFQGFGVGNRLSEFCAAFWTGLGGRAYSTTSHPAMIRHRSASPLWRRARLGIAAPPGRTGVLGRSTSALHVHSVNRLTGGFQYVGPAMPSDEAQRLAGARRITL